MSQNIEAFMIPGPIYAIDSFNQNLNFNLQPLVLEAISQTQTLPVLENCDLTLSELSNVAPEAPKRRPPRARYSQHQTAILENAYEQTHYLTLAFRKQLSEASKLTEQQVKIWFRNRRSRERRRLKRLKEREERERMEDLAVGEVFSRSDFLEFFGYEGPVKTEDEEFRCPHEFFHETTIMCPCAF